MSAGMDVVRREGSREVRVLGVIVIALLIGAYLSWTKKAEKATTEKVTLVDLKPDDLAGMEMHTKTQTVSVSQREEGKTKYYWFSLESGSRKRGFVGGKAVKDLIESFAPLKAIRSLGSDFTPAQLDEMKFTKVEGKLILHMRGGDRVLDLGGRSYGARDWYVRPAGGKEIYLVSSRVLADLEFPEGRFMQRQLKTLEPKEIAAVTIKAGDQVKKAIHGNMLSEKDAFWADEATPSEANETLGNYLDKLNSLTAVSYLEESVLADATPVLEVAWYKDDEPKENMKLLRIADGDKHKYVAVSTATILPVEVTRSTAEQLEQDLAVVLAK